MVCGVGVVVGEGAGEVVDFGVEVGLLHRPLHLLLDLVGLRHDPLHAVAPGPAVDQPAVVLAVELHQAREHLHQVDEQRPTQILDVVTHELQPADDRLIGNAVQLAEFGDVVASDVEFFKVVELFDAF